MIIGKISCSDLLPMIYGLVVTNSILIVLFFIFGIIAYRKLLRDNSIIARMVNRLLGDIPN